MFKVIFQNLSLYWTSGEWITWQGTPIWTENTDKPGLLRWPGLSGSVCTTRASSLLGTRSLQVAVFHKVFNSSLQRNAFVSEPLLSVVICPIRTCHKIYMPFSPPLIHLIPWGLPDHIGQVAKLLFLKNKFIYLIYLFLAVLGLHCCTRAFSSCRERGLLFIAARGLLIAVASLVAEHGL